MKNREIEILLEEQRKTIALLMEKIEKIEENTQKGFFWHINDFLGKGSVIVCAITLWQLAPKIVEILDLCDCTLTNTRLILNMM